MDRAGHLLVEQLRAGGAIDPGLVPIPSSPRKRAPGIGRERRLEVLLAGLGVGADHLTRSNRSSTPVTLTPRGLEGTVNRTFPAQNPRAGPVNTSPLGMLRRPSELIQVRPSTRRRRSVPSALIRTSRAGRRRSTRRCWRGAQLPPGGDRIGAVEEQRPCDERRVLAFAHPGLLGERGRRPQRAAPATRRASPPGSRRERAADPGDAGSGRPRRARACSRARRSRPRVAPLRLGQLERREAVELALARVRDRSPRSARRRRAAAAATRRARSTARCSASASGAASVVRARPATCWPGCTLQAPVAQQRRERVRVGRDLTVPRARGSARPRARAARRARTAARPPEAIR